MTDTLRIYSGRNRPDLKPIYAMYEELTGRAVEMIHIPSEDVYDRIIAEKNDPQVDLLVTNTQVMPELVRPEGVFEPYRASVAVDYDPWLRAEDFSWLSFTVWPRTAMINWRVLGQDGSRWPTRIEDFLSPELRDATLCSSAGETMMTSYFAALRVTRGDEWVEKLVDGLLANGMRIYRSNIDCRNALVREGYAATLANGSNTHAFFLEGHPVGEAWLDQGEGEVGTLIEAHTVAVLKGARNPEAARDFIDFLLSREIQEFLARLYGETPVNSAARVDWLRPTSSIRRIPATLDQIAPLVASTETMLRAKGFDVGAVTEENRRFISVGRTGRRDDREPGGKAA
ncbi:ABC transporter substrate-binding protein [Rhizobium puerariae]|uniref:ABC transporter substrate-binding protein n=1 Tax=Rhizobium puerariae TaxID=1585791 RepID=A0ABV6AQX9_9HYPH